MVSISEQVSEYAWKVYKKLVESGLRTSIDVSDRTLQYKIRDAKMKEIPYTLIIGRNEAESDTISVRMRNGTQKNRQKLEDFITGVKDEVARRHVPNEGV